MKTSLRLGETTTGHLEAIAARWGMETRAEVVRLALRVVGGCLPALAAPPELHRDVGAPQSYYLDPPDQAAATRIAQHYGVRGQSAAVRIAAYLVYTLGLTLALSSLSKSEEVCDG